MKEATGKFEIRIGDGSSWVVVRDEAVGNVLWPLESPG
jgi:hypothetical protein